jgi:hypothetical protein
MTPSAIAVMIAVPGIVWGGFILFLCVAILKEGKKGGERGTGTNS